MTYGFRKPPTDRDFARRSAQYLAAHGYRPKQIRAALITQLEMPRPVAEHIATTIAS